MSAKLIVTDKGDPTVGIFEQSWEVDSPFTNDMNEEELKTSSDDLEFFRKQIIEVYKEYSQGKVTAMYCFEIEKLGI